MKTMKNYIENDLRNHLKYYFDLVYQSKGDLVIDGVRAFNEKSQFVEGKVINACNYLYETQTNDEIVLENLQEIIAYSVQGKYETWGILNCIVSLYRLKQNGKFDEVIKEDVLDILKKKLDWRTFVNEDDLTLIDKPTNYYGVAFGIAKYRELLGFEEAGFSEKLLKKLICHIDKYSGTCCFMDETEGQGRFDRYSTLIPAEICAMLANTDCDIPEKLLLMLRKSSEIYLNLANLSGNGFTYGRSIGAYGDTAALETLSIAARLNILNDEEKEIAYTYNTLIISKFFNFWIDKETKSLNMWDKGRKTDKYRNKNRILGENLSLAMQIVNTFENWKLAGYENVQPIENFADKLKTLDSLCTFKFCNDRCSRAMLIIRDRNHVFSMPIINGGKPYYNQTPYLPIPNESRVFESSPDTNCPNLLPKFTLKDGREVMPIVYFSNLKSSKIASSNNHVINYELDGLCLIDGELPALYSEITGKITYEFSEGQINCNMIFDNESENLQDMIMKFGTYSNNPSISDSKVTFADGVVTDIETEGFKECNYFEVNNDSNYFTSHGSLNNVVEWKSTDLNNSKQINISWTVKYNNI